MNTEKINFLQTYLSLYINHSEVLPEMQKPNSNIVVLDVRNAPAQIKQDQIKGSIAIPAKDLADHIDELDHEKTYVVYDWTAGTTLGKVALLVLLTNGLKAFELSCALDGCKGMHLPVESIA